MKILTHTKYNPSARILMAAIRDLGIACSLVHDPDDIGDSDVFLRYGNSSTVRSQATDIGFNSREFIAISGNKMRTSEFFTGLGVRTPIYNTMSDIPEESNFPIIVRTDPSSFGGRGINVVETSAEWHSFTGVENAIWTQFLQIEREYRAHLIDGDVTKIFKKEPREGVNELYPIRNMKNYHFSLRRSMEPFSRMLSFINTINEAIDIGFAALDIGFLSAEREYILIEPNSAPGLNEDSAMRYAEAVLRRLP